MSKKLTFDSVAEVQAYAAKDADRVIFIVKNGVYDVTEYLPNHPGGPTPLVMAKATDATKAFADADHPDNAVMQMEDYRIGTVKKAATPKPASSAGPAKLLIAVAVVAVAGFFAIKALKK